MSAFFSLLGLLPDLIKLVKAVMALVNRMGGDDPQAFLQKCTQTFQELHQAKTPEDYDAAARKISELYRHLP